VPDFVSVTRGPGMSTNLAVGLNTAKGLALAWDVPLLAVHHMQAHALTPRLVDALGRPWGSLSSSPPLGTSLGEGDEGGKEFTNPAFPFLTLLVSGGHTQLVLSRSLTSHSTLADCSPMAIGNMLDAAARLILPPSVLSGSETVGYGPALEEFAFPGSLGRDRDAKGYDYGYNPPQTRCDDIVPFVSEAYNFSITPPLAGRRTMEFCFAGLCSQVQKIVADNKEMMDADVEARRALARATMQVAFEHLARRVLFALEGSFSCAPKAEMRRGRRGAAFAAREDEKEEGDDGRVDAGAQADEEKPPQAQENQNQNQITTTLTIITTTTTPTSPATKTRREQKTNPIMTELQLSQQEQDQQQQKEITKIKTLVLSGGVASNAYLRHIIRSTLSARGFGVVSLVAPPVALCTDNAAMIAWTGAEMWEAGYLSPMDCLARRKWSLDCGEGSERDMDGDRNGDGGVLGFDGEGKRNFLRR